MHPVVHFEITANDMQRASDFYHKAFGWHITFMPEYKYTVVTTSPVNPTTRMHEKPGAINGGIMHKKDQLQHPIITISTNNMDESIQAVKDAGGTIVGEPYDVGTMGIAAYFKDTEGNIMGLWQDKSMK